MKIDCFVIIPSNRETGPPSKRKTVPVTLVGDDRWGLVEKPSGIEVGQTIEIDFDEVYKHIIQKAAANVQVELFGKRVDIECRRGTDLDKSGDILTQVIEKTCLSKITVIDLTTLNPNVFLELGIRLVANHTLNILMCHRGVTLPFDIQHQRVIWYEMGTAASNDACDEITAAITDFLSPVGADAPPAVIEDRFKRYFDIYTGRKRDRELVDAYSEVPKLVRDIASYLYAQTPDPTLKPRLFKFVNSVVDVLKNDRGSIGAAIDFLETICQIDNLSDDKLGDLYQSLQEICAADYNRKDQAGYWMQKLQELEGVEK